MGESQARSTCLGLYVVDDAFSSLSSSATVGSSQSIRPALLLQELSAGERQGLPGPAEASRRKASQLATDLILHDLVLLADNASAHLLVYYVHATHTCNTEVADTLLYWLVNRVQACAGELFLTAV